MRPPSDRASAPPEGPPLPLDSRPPGRETTIAPQGAPPEELPRSDGLPPSAAGRLRLLDRVLFAEARLRYQDMAVFGGFHSFALRILGEPPPGLAPALAKEIRNLQGDLAGYARASIPRRRELVQQARGLLAAVLSRIEEPAGRGTASPALRATRASGPPAGRPPIAITPGTPVDRLPGVGPRRASLLELLGLRTAGDLLDHRPLRYVDQTGVTPLAGAMAGTSVTIQATVETLARWTGSRAGRVVARLRDPSGTMEAVWFGRPWVLQKLRRGQSCVLHGPLRDTRGRVSLVNPEVVDLTTDPDRPPVQPVYPLTQGLDQGTIRRLVGTVLPLADRIDDPLAAALLQPAGLPARGPAYRSLHRPSNLEEAEHARRRLAYDEFFTWQLVHRLGRRRTALEVTGVTSSMPAGVRDEVQSVLGFRFTASQDRVLDEIFADLSAPRPMARLLQGDVGSGKTAVALTCLVAMRRLGFQGALMAPTEVLAEQHHLTLAGACDRLDVPVALLTGATPRRARRQTLERLASGELGLLVGTHALLSEDVAFHRLGLAVIDEQHRFGVMQRDRLTRKGVAASVLVMTATPIPRTLTLALYGDLDQSTIDELPAGRRPITTTRVSPARCDRIHARIVEEVRRGRQAYVICPLVEESDERALENAVQLHRSLATGPFHGLSVGLLHGRLPSREKEDVMDGFRSGRIEVLVSTTVVEVGVDVPRATIMLIMDAGSFGLSQLHQLRGRIGRGEWPGQCYLVQARSGDGARERLETLVATTDGFRIAEADLKLRGPGELFGTRQSGIPDLRFADLGRDLELLTRAHRDVRDLLASDPSLDHPDHAGLAQLVRDRTEALRLH